MKIDMLPHFKTFLYLCFYVGREKAEFFLSKYQLLFFRDSDIQKSLSGFKQKAPKEIYNYVKELLNGGKQDVEKHLPSIDHINSFFGTKIKKSPDKFIHPNPQRILSNYELRTFVEVLILSDLDFPTICKYVRQKFKINEDFSEQDIGEYSNLFFSRKLMDDIDWQYYVSRLDEHYRISGESHLIEDARKKSFAMRNSKNDVLLNLGLDKNLNYVDMLSDIACSVYSDVRHGIQNKEEWSVLKTRISTFVSLGNAYSKHTSVNKTSNPFEEFIIEVDRDEIESIPFINSDGDSEELSFLNEEKD